jgi:hypothetical protein
MSVEILEKMKQTLLDLGWIKGELYADDQYQSGCCLIGSWYIANGYGPETLLFDNLESNDSIGNYEEFNKSEEAELLSECSIEKIGHDIADDPEIKPSIHVVYMNDGGRTTKEDVLEVIDCALSKANG